MTRDELVAQAKMFAHAADTEKAEAKHWKSRAEAAEAALALQAQPWQPIEKCPDFAEFIIGAWPVGDGSFDVGELSREGLHWFSIVGSREEPTHWMPLPSLPSAAAPVKED